MLPENHAQVRPIHRLPGPGSPVECPKSHPAGSDDDAVNMLSEDDDDLLSDTKGAPMQATKSTPY